MYAKLSRLLITTAIGVVLLVIGATTYRMGLHHVEADIYRKRLEALSNDYTQLQALYNKAVAKTTVSELRVGRDHVHVVIRNLEGEVQTIDTPFHPSQEIHVDYVVFENRLWIRRVYTIENAAAQIVEVDPKFLHLDWSNPNLQRGIVVYRGGLSEGRWAVTTAGNGALDLARLPEDAPERLTAAPPVRDFEQSQKELEQQVNSISVGDVFKQLVGLSE